METYNTIGDWNAICDVCGGKFKASQLRKRWDNLRVCSADWEPRNEQDFVRATRDRQAVPWTRPESPDMVLTVNPLDPDDVTYSLMPETSTVLEMVDTLEMTDDLEMI